MDTTRRGNCQVCQLGTVTFPEAMDFEHRLIELRSEAKRGDILLIFEHPPTITLGTFGKKENVLASPEELEQKGVSFFNSDRGGDATFNCPGQLVIHPIMNLRLRGARAYIGDLEEMGLRVLTDYGIAAQRSSQHPGIWVNNAQIGAVGLRFSRGVSMHGLSLNVNPDLALFNLINLCGLPGRLATSIANELGYSVSMAGVTRRVMEHFADVFQVELLPISKEQLKNECFETQNAR